MIGRRRWTIFVISLLMATTLIAGLTYRDLGPALRLDQSPGSSRRALILDREGQPLRISYNDNWNYTDQVDLDSIPPILLSAIIAAEDSRYFQHGGVDWRARFAALWLNLRKGTIKRGASTITEQVVRLLRPRPRTLWSKWLEGWDALRLERENSKTEILRFYVNQVPFHERRRGLVQAARGFFNRSLDTLNLPEMLTLAVMIKRPIQMGQDYKRLGERLFKGGWIGAEQWQEVQESGPPRIVKPELELEAPHFISYIDTLPFENPVRTTLDPGVQQMADHLLHEALRRRPKRDVAHAAALVVDHSTDEVLAWVSTALDSENGGAYNSPLIPRQPGSSLKPFLYATAFAMGYGPKTLIEDAPLMAAVGSGLHDYRNYSRVFYGWVTLRESLANSLNIPAVRLIREIGVEQFLGRLRAAGIRSLDLGSTRYGEGLALGNGEVPLWQMVQAYSCLARQGLCRPLRALQSQPRTPGKRVWPLQAVNAVNDILSDPFARRWEFGRGGNLEFPVETAVKTGTSTDFRDAWAFAYNYRFVIGVWMGNLDNRPTDGLSGAAEPMLAARALMNKVLQGHKTQRLSQSQSLDGRPRIRSEGTEFRIIKPAQNTHMALDPRVPSAMQAFDFEVEGHDPSQRIHWELNGQPLTHTNGPKARWTLSRGRHELSARQGANLSRRVFFVR